MLQGPAEQLRTMTLVSLIRHSQVILYLVQFAAVSIKEKFVPVKFSLLRSKRVLIQRVQYARNDVGKIRWCQLWIIPEATSNHKS